MNRIFYFFFLIDYIKLFLTNFQYFIRPRIVKNKNKIIDSRVGRMNLEIFARNARRPDIVRVWL